MTAWGPALAWVAVLFFLSRLTAVPEPLQALTVVPDKVIHALLYTVLGAAFAWGRRRSGWAPPHTALIALGSLYGALDEWHQSFVPGRTPEVGDWVADTVGVILGYWTFTMILRGRHEAPAPEKEHK